MSTMDKVLIGFYKIPAMGYAQRDNQLTSQLVTVKDEQLEDTEGGNLDDNEKPELHQTILRILIP